MKLIVGLGNPGLRYKYTRHNIGYMAVDRLASSLRIRVKKKIFDSLIGRGKIDGKELMLVKPLTYMNLSGKAVCAIKEKEDISLEDLLIVMDDIDLPLGKIRLRKRGSSGGHKGLRSVIEELGTDEFPRLRLGIGRRSYVLAPFNKDERAALSDLIDRSCDCLILWIKDGIEPAMNRFNSALS